ncbi:MAG: HepT-like ribonuclease domain-containing protein [Thermomicrobiales bacterium]
MVERNFEIIGLRNQLIHAYDNMDWELIWQITSSLCQCCEPKLINF